MDRGLQTPSFKLMLALNDPDMRTYDQSKFGKIFLTMTIILDHNLVQLESFRPNEGLLKRTSSYATFKRMISLNGVQLLKL